LKNAESYGQHTIKNNLRHLLSAFITVLSFRVEGLKLQHQM